MTSLPRPSDRKSPPGPPTRKSFPSFPYRLSSPRPPQRTSLPPPPWSSSAPPLPQMTSAPPVPWSTSCPFVPTIVQAAVLAWVGIDGTGPSANTATAGMKTIRVQRIARISSGSSVRDGRSSERSHTRPEGSKRERTAPAQHVVEHRRRQLPRERVLLARVEASEDPIGADGRFHPMTEPRSRTRRAVAETGDRAQRAIPGERSQRNDHAYTGEGAELSLQEREAAIALLGGRAVPRRSASVHRAEIGTAESEAVVHGRGRRPVREAGAMQRREQEVPRAIAREDPPRPVTSMRGRRKPEDEDPRVRVAESRHRPPPVRLVREAGHLVPGDLLAPGDEPWASATHDDVVPEIVQRGRHGVPVPTRAKMS